MDALTLLRDAKAAGLRVEAVGDLLKISGPRQAESVVKLLAEHKLAVLAALRPNAESNWAERFYARTFNWAQGKRSWEAAQCLAWGDLLNEWHERYGRRWPRWQCAGCGKPIGGLAALDLPDGNRVHFDDINCLITFGRHWRGRAQDGLIALGLEPPESEDVQW